MTTRAHVFVFVVVLLSIAFVGLLIRRRYVRSKYGLLWALVSAALVPLALWPDLLEEISDWLGVAYAPTTFLVFALAFVLLVLVHYSFELTRLEERVRTLAEEVAMRELESQTPARPDHEVDSEGPDEEPDDGD